MPEERNPSQAGGENRGSGTMNEDNKQRGKGRGNEQGGQASQAGQAGQANQAGQSGDSR